MSEPKTFASLSPGLLARKGGAKPAMRPQLQPIQQFHEATARQLEDDLGWNDHGDAQSEGVSPDMPEDYSGQVIALNGVEVFNPAVPEVVRRQEAAAIRVARSRTPRRSALSRGARAAFTLRLDAERHLKLRLAATISNRSAQQIVTEALDRLIDEMEDIDALASKLKKRS